MLPEGVPQTWAWLPFGPDFSLKEEAPSLLEEWEVPPGCPLWASLPLKPPRKMAGCPS